MVIRKLFYILLIIQTINITGQFPADSFDVIFSQDFEDDETGWYSDWGDDWPYNLGWFVNHDDTHIEEKGSTKAMRWDYPKGTANMVDEHGGKFHSWFDALGTQYDEIYFSYDVMFKSGFDFVQSGKTPNLNIGERWETDHSYPYYDEGASAAIRWSSDKSYTTRGRYFFYIYSHNKTRVVDGELVQGTWGIPWSDPDNPENTWWIHPTEEEWINITIRVVMNSVNAPPEYGDKNGIFEAYVNGKYAAGVDTVIWRNYDTIGVKLMKIYSQFGGIGEMFETTRDEWILLDNFRAWVYDESVEGVPRGRETSSWGRRLNLLPSWSNTTEISGIVDSKDIHSPSVPANIQVIGLTENTISIKWNAATDNVNVTGYRIFVNDELIDATASTNCEVNGLSPGTEYSIKITAIDAAGNESNHSDPVKVTTKHQDNEPPSIPQGVMLTGLTESSISLTWEESIDDVSVSGYHIFLDGEMKGTSINNQYLISNLSPDTQYEITVSAFDTKGNISAQSDPIYATTKKPDEIPPTAPTGLSADNITENSIHLVWNPSSDNNSVRGYHITANGLRRGTSFSNSHQMEQLNPGIEYKISVSAYDDAGNESLPSNQILVSTINPDESVQPSLPEIELVELKKNINTVSTISEVKSFGYTEMQDYGVIISEESEEILNGSVIYGSSDSTSILNDQRVTDGLEALYNFSENEGTIIYDITKNRNGPELHIERELNTIWQRGQGLKVLDNTIIASDGSFNNLINTLKESGEITIETWVKSSIVNQKAPASIVSFSNANNERFFALGQNGNLASYNYIFGFNTLDNETEDTAEIVYGENFVHSGLHHIIFTRDHNGGEKLYINGLENYSGVREGNLFSMDSACELVLANEITGEKPWLGTYYLLAIYSKSLSYQEVDQNYKAGFGTLQFESALVDFEPNVQYHISPFVRTDQGIVYGKAESFMIENIRIHEEIQDKDTLLMAVFPNPSSGIFTVEFEDTGKSSSSAIIHIADQSGQIKYIEEYDLPAGMYSGTKTLNLNGISNRKGFYSVIVIMGSKSAARKLIII